MEDLQLVGFAKSAPRFVAAAVEHGEFVAGFQAQHVPGMVRFRAGENRLAQVGKIKSVAHPPKNRLAFSNQLFRFG